MLLESEFKTDERWVRRDYQREKNGQTLHLSSDVETWKIVIRSRSVYLVHHSKNIGQSRRYCTILIVPRSISNWTTRGFLHLQCGVMTLTAHAPIMQLDGSSIISVAYVRHQMEPSR